MIGGYNMDERKRAFNEYEMLKGSVNRMFLEDVKWDLQERYQFAKVYLEHIYEYNLQRIKEGK